MKMRSKCFLILVWIKLASQPSRFNSPKSALTLADPNMIDGIQESRLFGLMILSLLLVILILSRFHAWWTLGHLQQGCQKGIPCRRQLPISVLSPREKIFPSPSPRMLARKLFLLSLSQQKNLSPHGSHPHYKMQYLEGESKCMVQNQYKLNKKYFI